MLPYYWDFVRYFERFYPAVMSSSQLVILRSNIYFKISYDLLGIFVGLEVKEHLFFFQIFAKMSVTTFKRKVFWKFLSKLFLFRNCLSVQSLIVIDNKYLASITQKFIFVFLRRDITVSDMRLHVIAIFVYLKPLHDVIIWAEKKIFLQGIIHLDERKMFWKIKISYPLIHARTFGY